MDRLADIRAFIAVADSGSFVAGARRLGLAPAHVSKLVARLEAELQARLLQRTTRDVALTEAGRLYLAGARPLLEDFAALQASVGEADAPRGTLTVSAPVSFGQALEPALLDFAAAHPAVTLAVSYSDRRVNLVEEGIDLAIRIANLADSSLVARRLGETEIVTCAAPAYLVEHGVPTAPQDLAQHPAVIDLNSRDPFGWNFGRAGARIDVRVEGRLRFANPATCLAAAARGFGIAQAPDFAAHPFLADGSLVPVLAEWAPEPLAIHAVHPAARHRPARLRAFVDFLAAWAAQNGAGGERVIKASITRQANAPSAAAENPSI